MKPAATAKAAADRRRSRTLKRLPKLSLAVACSCHLILAARATTGAGSDHPRFAPLLDAAWARAEVAVVVADAGFDAEAHHERARDRMGVASVIPAALSGVEGSAGRRTRPRPAPTGPPCGSGSQPPPTAAAATPTASGGKSRR